MIDLSLGYAAQVAFNHQSSGKFGSLLKAVKGPDEAVLIVGSSHANRHYVPSVFSEVLEVPCTNLGVQGQKLMFQDALIRISLEKSQPETIVLNIDANWLYEVSGDRDRLNDLKPIYWQYRDILHPVLSEGQSLTDLRMLLHSYRLNSTIAHIIKYRLSPELDQDGFRPLKRPYTDRPILEFEPAGAELDSKLVATFTDLVDLIAERDTRLILVVSPMCKYNLLTSENDSLNRMKQIASQRGVIVFDELLDPDFVGHEELFSDPSHLNEIGAKLFSRKLAKKIQEQTETEPAYLFSAQSTDLNNFSKKIQDHFSAVKFGS